MYFGIGMSVNLQDPWEDGPWGAFLIDSSTCSVSCLTALKLLQTRHVKVRECCSVFLCARLVAKLSSGFPLENLLALASIFIQHNGWSHISSQLDRSRPGWIWFGHLASVINAVYIKDQNSRAYLATKQHIQPF